MDAKMRSGRSGRGNGPAGRGMAWGLVAALVLAGQPARVFAGNEYVEALKFLNANDPKGLELMEAVCLREPNASNAFLDLAKGYLRIKKDAAMASDAALRGLEGYDDRWQWRVPKKTLYDVLGQAGITAAPEALAEMDARLAKLAETDGKLAQDVIARLAGKPRGAIAAVNVQKDEKGKVTKMTMAKKGGQELPLNYDAQAKALSEETGFTRFKIEYTLSTRGQGKDAETILVIRKYTPVLQGRVTATKHPNGQLKGVRIAADGKEYDVKLDGMGAKLAKDMDGKMVDAAGKLGKTNEFAVESYGETK